MLSIHARAGHGLVASLVASCMAVIGCVDDDGGLDEDSVGSIGVIESAITGSSIRSIDGAYGSGCLGRASGKWSLAVASGAMLQYAPLSVAAGNSACVLTLTSIRTSDPVDGS